MLHIKATMSANVLMVCFVIPVSAKNRLEGYKVPNGKAPPERGIFFRFHVYKRVGFSVVEVYERVRISVISFCGKTTQKS